MTFKLTHSVTVEGKQWDLLVEVEQGSCFWTNDGIGAYECHGFKGYDHGHDYIEEFQVEKMVNEENGKIIMGVLKEELTNALADDSDFMEKLEDAYKSWSDEMKTSAEIDRLDYFCNDR
jgi:hypothetical protein